MASSRTWSIKTKYVDFRLGGIVAVLLLVLVLLLSVVVVVVPPDGDSRTQPCSDELLRSLAGGSRRFTPVKIYPRPGGNCPHDDRPSKARPTRDACKTVYVGDVCAALAEE